MNVNKELESLCRYLEKEEWSVRLKEKIIRTAESHDVILKFTSLNNSFSKRVKEENRELNEKNINEKRVTKSPKERECQKRWGVEDRE
ncbi:uncharacterized protein OCT59_027983 [Rhizophagus irregularis]|uniref:uncharacterized protein n=1 Tax=Rhizophagus irregularis TaxID=588596 RepID=UPI001C1446BB|nr:hypothetical protein OCT59_027983 [Rhizophagus irregularis]CAB4381384.1 unnamed protein product [Rhizophagus irregularis]